MQFSLFGAEAAEPALHDLDGLLFAGGDWALEAHATADPARRTGARLSVLVADDWRAHALCGELNRRGLEADIADAPGDLLAVRSESTSVLVPQAHRWRRGASLRVPPDLVLSPSGLRLWAVAAGTKDELGYLLGTAERNAVIHRAAGKQLAGLGIAAVELTGRGGPGWRVTSARRLRRLMELLGPAPDGGARDWGTS